MNSFFKPNKINLFPMDKRGVTVVKCGCKITQGHFLTANENGEAVLSKTRFDVIGVALEDGEKDDMIRMRLY